MIPIKYIKKTPSEYEDEIKNKKFYDPEDQYYWDRMTLVNIANIGDELKYHFIVERDYYDGRMMVIDKRFIEVEELYYWQIIANTFKLE